MIKVVTDIKGNKINKLQKFTQIKKIKRDSQNYFFFIKIVKILKIIKIRVCFFYPNAVRSMSLLVDVNVDVNVYSILTNIAMSLQKNKDCRGLQHRQCLVDLFYFTKAYFMKI